MKKNVVIIVYLFLGISCTVTPKYYQGYIYSTKKKPIFNIKICEQNTEKCSKTDDFGFFRIQKNENSINNLIVYKDNTPIDTIKTVWSQHGEKINYSFLENRKDTLFIDIEK